VVVVLCMRRTLFCLLASAFLASCEPSVLPAYVPMSGAAPAAQLPSTRTVLVVFWASWCVPCRKELPEVARLAEDPPAGLQIVGFSQDEDLESAQSFLIEIGAGQLTTRLDPDGDIAEEFGVNVLPGAVLVVDGGLRARFDGAQMWNSNPMRSLLTRLSAP
jgi:thiol-disulfide isomerase/thioredoxin